MALLDQILLPRAEQNIQQLAQCEVTELEKTFDMASAWHCWMSWDSSQSQNLQSGALCSEPETLPTLKLKPDLEIGTLHKSLHCTAGRKQVAGTSVSTIPGTDSGAILPRSHWLYWLAARSAGTSGIAGQPRWACWGSSPNQMPHRSCTGQQLGWHCWHCSPIESRCDVDWQLLALHHQHLVTTELVLELSGQDEGDTLRLGGDNTCWAPASEAGKACAISHRWLRWGSSERSSLHRMAQCGVGKLVAHANGGAAQNPNDRGIQADPVCNCRLLRQRDPSGGEEVLSVDGVDTLVGCPGPVHVVVLGELQTLQLEDGILLLSEALPGQEYQVGLAVAEHWPC